MAWSKKIIKKIKTLEIKTRPLVNDLMSGNFSSSFKGSGMVFEDFREYVVGDDVRNMSWQIMAKTGTPYIKKFIEEKQRDIFVVFDVSGSQFFGSASYLKSELCLHLFSVIAFSALKQKEAFGALFFTDQIEAYFPPKKDRTQIFHVLKELMELKSSSLKSDLSCATHFLKSSLKKRSTIFILSDFLNMDFKRDLDILSQKHEVFCFCVEDELEKKIPSMGLVRFFDPETNKDQVFDTSLSFFSKTYQKKIKEVFQKRDQQFYLTKADHLILSTKDDYYKKLISFFKRKR